MEAAAILLVNLAIFAVLGLGFWLAYRRFGPSRHRHVASHPVEAFAPFRAALPPTLAGPHVLYLRYEVEFRGSEETDYELALQLTIDGVPSRTTLPSGGWASSLSSSGERARHAITCRIVTVEPRGDGASIVLEGILTPSSNVTGGRFALELFRA